MILGAWWSFGAESASTAAAGGGPQWAYGSQGRTHRVYKPRARGNDVWVQSGDLRDPDPILDTWEGEAT